MLRITTSRNKLKDKSINPRVSLILLKGLSTNWKQLWQH